TISALSDPGTVRSAPTLFACPFRLSSARAYCSIKTGDHGVPFRYVENPSLRNRTRRAPWRSVFHPQCLGRALFVRSIGQDLIPRVWFAPFIVTLIRRVRLFGLTGDNRDLAAVGVYLDRTDLNPSHLAGPDHPPNACE